MQFKTETKVGLFVIVAFVMLAYMAHFLTAFNWHLNSYESYTVLFNNVCGLTKKADELLETLKDSNKNLYAKLSKLQRNTEVGKSDARIKSDKHKVDIARKNVNNDAMRYAKEKLIGKGKAAIITKSIGAASDKKATNGEN